PECAWTGVLGKGRDDRAQLLRALATLHLRGCAVDWAGLHDAPRRVPGPTYPWERERYWFRPARPGSGNHSTPRHRVPDPDPWRAEAEVLHELAWVPAQPRAAGHSGGQRVLLVGDDPLTLLVGEALRGHGAAVSQTALGQATDVAESVAGVETEDGPA